MARYQVLYEGAVPPREFSVNPAGNVAEGWIFLFDPPTGAGAAVTPCRRPLPFDADALDAAVREARRVGAVARVVSLPEPDAAQAAERPARRRAGVR